MLAFLKHVKTSFWPHIWVLKAALRSMSFSRLHYLFLGNWEKLPPIRKEGSFCQNNNMLSTHEYDVFLVGYVVFFEKGKGKKRQLV